MAKLEAKQIQINGVEDMANYFHSVRDFFIHKAPCLTFDNLFINAILVRAHQINKGFLELTNSGNFLCAAPLVRMQVETLCRLYGGYIVDSDNYIPKFMNGEKVDNLTARGRKLSYTTLVIYLAEDLGLAELPRIYEEGNSFIHPTDVAFKASIWNEDRKVTIQNLEGRLYEDSEMEAIKNDMLYVNLCFPKVIYMYQMAFLEFVNATSDTTNNPPVHPEDKYKDKIEGFLDNIKRDTGSSEDN